MGSDREVKGVQNMGDDEIEQFSGGSSSEESFLNGSERSSSKSSVEEKVEEQKIDSVESSVEGSRKSSMDGSLKSLEGSKTSSVEVSGESKQSSNKVSLDNSLQASDKSSVQDLESSLVSEPVDAELGNANAAVNENQADYEYNPLKPMQGVNNDKILVNPFGPNMESGERMLRVFLVLGVFPLPVLGWIIGLFSSMSIKKKKRIHKILTSMLFLLTLVSLIGAMVIVGYFLVKNSKNLDDEKSSSDKLKDKRLDYFTRETDIKKIADDFVKALGVTIPPQEPGKYKPVPLVALPKPSFKHGKPKLEFIPPSNLQEPIPLTKTTGDLRYEYFEYKHPSSKKELVILMRGLHKDWKSHEMFRFSDYVDHSIMVFNITKNDKNLDLAKILTALSSQIKYKTNVGLVAEIKKEDIVGYEAKHNSMKIMRLLAITPAAKCDRKSLSGGSNVEFVGIMDKSVTCSAGLKTPIMLVKNGVVSFSKMGEKLEDLKSVISKEKSDCDYRMHLKDYTMEYLDKVFTVFRKFISVTSEEQKDQLALQSLCSKM